MVSILRCSVQLALKLKEEGFPQRSLRFSNLYYATSNVVVNNKEYRLGDYIYNADDYNIDLSKVVFIPYYAEALDWLEVERNLSIPIWFNGHSYKYNVYDNSEDITETGDDTICYTYTGNNIERPESINEEAINFALDYLKAKKSLTAVCEKP